MIKQEAHNALLELAEIIDACPKEIKLQGNEAIALMLYIRLKQIEGHLYSIDDTLIELVENAKK